MENIYIFLIPENSKKQKWRKDNLYVEFTGMQYAYLSIVFV